jgi:hypothetical protein
MVTYIACRSFVAVYDGLTIVYCCTHSQVTDAAGAAKYSAVLPLLRVSHEHDVVPTLSAPVSLAVKPIELAAKLRKPAAAGTAIITTAEPL